MENPRVRCRVSITIEMDAGSVWGADCSMGQILKQAGEESVQTINNILHESRNSKGARVVGTPIVTAILADGQ